MSAKPQTMRTFSSNEGKLKELILYIAANSQDDPKFGSTKLNKLLFACDLFAYGELGAPVTGVTYAKRQHGPAPRRIPVVIEEMIGEGCLVVAPRPYGRYKQNRPIALRAADLSAFSAAEVALIHEVLQTFEEVNAKQISQWSHGLCGWAIAEPDQDIPYEAVFLSDLPLTAYEAERGRQLALEHGWDVF